MTTAAMAASAAGAATAQPGLLPPPPGSSSSTSIRRSHRRPLPTTGKGAPFVDSIENDGHDDQNGEPARTPLLTAAAALPQSSSSASAFPIRLAPNAKDTTSRSLRVVRRPPATTSLATTWNAVDNAPLNEVIPTTSAVATTGPILRNPTDTTGTRSSSVTVPNKSPPSTTASKIPHGADSRNETRPRRQPTAATATATAATSFNHNSTTIAVPKSLPTREESQQQLVRLQPKAQKLVAVAAVATPGYNENDDDYGEEKDDKDQILSTRSCSSNSRSPSAKPALQQQYTNATTRSLPRHRNDAPMAATSMLPASYIKSSDSNGSSTGTSKSSARTQDDSATSSQSSGVRTPIPKESDTAHYPPVTQTAATIGTITPTTVASSAGSRYNDASSMERTPIRKTTTPDRRPVASEQEGKVGATTKGMHSTSTAAANARGLLGYPDWDDDVDDDEDDEVEQRRKEATTASKDQRRLQNVPLPNAAAISNSASAITRSGTHNQAKKANNSASNGIDTTGSTAQLLTMMSSSSNQLQPGANNNSSATTTTTTTTSPLLKKAALSRPFGRDDPAASILPFGAGWVVEVSDEAEWDATQKAFKYRILVQRRTSSNIATPNNETNVVSTANASSFTSAFTWRTVADFEWLAHALMWEFQGALLLPRLRIPASTDKNSRNSGSKSTPQQHHPVESAILKHWLTDVLNGVRGSGEWLLPVVQQQPPQSTTSGGVRTTAADDAYIDVMKSDSMETFLYRNSKGRSLHDTVGHSVPASTLEKQQRTTTLRTNQGREVRGGRMDEHDDDDPADNSDGSNTSNCHAPTSFLSSLWTAVATATPLELCVGPPLAHAMGAKSSSPHPRSQNAPAKGDLRYPYAAKTATDAVNTSMQRRLKDFSSGALGTAADFQVQDSFMDGSSSVMSGMSVSSLVASPRGSSALAIHSELLFAEKDLALHYQRTTEKARDKLRQLFEIEEKVSGAWKRFAVTLANLFTYEKDAESANLGDSKVKRENMPFRKVDKETIDECLCLVARSKTERNLPGLSILSAMLTAYAEDLMSVGPSVDVYAKAIRQLASGPLPIPVEESSNSNQSGGGGTASTVSSSSSSNAKQTISASSWDELKEWTMKSLKAKGGGGPAIGNPNDGQRHSKSFIAASALQQEEMKHRLITNERFLRQSLTTMLRTAPFRISRIAWRFWNTEATQCAQLNTAAAELRCKLDIISQSSVSKLLKRHSKDEKSDCATEMELIQRIVYLGQGKKFPSGSESVTDGSVSTTSINNELVEVDNDDLNEGRAKAIKRDKALDIARHRIGRWNAVLAMSLMEAVGVDDPNVHIEETTRDLRMVRKYAIGLRECLNRCVESVQILKDAITGDSGDSATASVSQSVSLPFPKQKSTPNQLKSLRDDFLAEMLELFSGTFEDLEKKSLPKRAVASRTVLSNAGIDTSDPFGWLPTAANGPVPRVSSSLSAKKSHSKRGVGTRAVQYVNVRDAQVEWLLSSLDGLLNEYYQRIEVVEGFVFMECVGIQLEKHFSTKRAKALSLFEKKTDLTTAVNMARKKRMTQLLTELQGKLDNLGTEVSHTTVKETKEAHLESKSLKSALHELAMRRLMRARETSTERVIAILSLWAKEEEINATEEIKALGEAMSVLERSVCHDDSSMER